MLLFCSRPHVSFLGLSQSYLIKKLKLFTRRPRTSSYTALKRSSASKPDFVNLFHSVYNFFVTFFTLSWSIQMQNKAMAARFLFKYSTPNRRLSEHASVLEKTVKQSPNSKRKQLSFTRWHQAWIFSLSQTQHCTWKLSSGRKLVSTCIIIVGRKNKIYEFLSFSSNIFLPARLVTTRNSSVSAEIGDYPSEILQFSKLYVLRKIFEG